MKVLLLSDSHGCTQLLKTVLQRESECELVVFLGDGLRDLERVKPAFKGKKLLCVRGNNDWDADGSCEDFAYKFIEGHTLIATHGHRCAVRYTLHDLAAKANAVRADLAFYGHTHQPRQETVDGVLCINPGALCSGQYAVLDVSKDNVAVTFKQN